MKRYILILLPIFGLKAQVTIGEPNDNTSALLNITVPGSVFIMPVGDKDQVTALSRSVEVDENSDPLEGSMIFHKKVNNSNVGENSGIFLRVRENSTTSSLNSNTNTTWKPFSKRNKVYVYNNNKKNYNEQLLGYTSGDGETRFNTRTCFKWVNTENNENPNANGHTYCLVDLTGSNSYGPINDPRLSTTACVDPAPVNKTHAFTQIISEAPRNISGSPTIGGVTVNEGNAVTSGNTQTRTVIGTRQYVYTIQVTDKIAEIKLIERLSLLQGKNWGCAYATAMVEEGYPATITSPEEFRYIMTKLENIASQTDNIAIGLRSLNYNEGDVVSYARDAAKFNKFLWVNGESNKTNWTGLIVNDKINVSGNNNLPLKDVNLLNNSSEATKTVEIYDIKKTLKYIVYYTATATQTRQRRFWGGWSSWTSINWDNQTWTKDPNKNDEQSLVSQLKQHVSTTVSPHLNDCGVLRTNITTTTLGVGNCDFGNYNKVLVEYNN